jgi:hypothetical protein
MIVLVLLGCNEKKEATINTKIYKLNEIPKNSVERLNDAYVYKIEFSNIIYVVNGKKLFFPIYQGKLGSVYHEDFLNYCVKNDILEKGARESEFFINVKKGEVKKTFMSFIEFYQNKFGSNFKKFERIYIQGDSPDFFYGTVVYKFKLDNVPCSLSISFGIDENDWDVADNYEELKDINFNEKSDTYITYDIVVPDYN